MLSEERSDTRDEMAARGYDREEVTRLIQESVDYVADHVILQEVRKP